jgi:hypothetical protein
MSEGYAKLDSMKGNKMEYRELVDVVKAKFDFRDESALVFILSLTWSLTSDKVKADVAKRIEEYNK